MLKIQSFDDFSKMKAEQAQAENLATQTKLREEAANAFKNLLSEYGVSKVSELSEEQRSEFLSKLQESSITESFVNESKEEEEAKAILQDLLIEYDPWELMDMLPGEASDTVAAYGHKGSTAKKITNALLGLIQSGAFESVVNEGALSISGLRTAKKVLTQYNQILNSKFNAIGQGGDKKSILGAVKYLFWNAMEDANFSREANAIMNNIKGGINTVMVPVEGLGGLMATVGATQIKRALDEEFNRISNAADWSGIGIVEGTALYLEQLGEATTAAKLLADFNAQFESKQVMESRIAEGNTFGAARAKAIADGKDEFEVDGETYKVKSVDKEDKENAEEFAGESTVTESYEVHYSDGVRAFKKFGNEKQAIDFAKDLIKNKKGLQFVDVFKAGSGFHSTSDTDAIVAFWGNGSYTDNVAKKDSKLAAKKINEAEVKSDDEFKEYAFTVLKKAFGNDFDEAKAQEVVDGILSKSDGDYGAAVGMLTSSLG